MRPIAAVAVLLLGAPALATPAPAPVEAADLYRMAMVTDPQVAPDGKHILFTRASFDIQTDTRQGELWLATLAGKALETRLLVGAAAKASNARWSPDGSRIAYVAPWLGKPQLWVMTLADGVGKPVTSLKTAPSDLAWSPDGSRIAFAAALERPPAKIAGMPEKPEGASWAPAPRIIGDFRYRNDAGGWITDGAKQLFVMPADGGAPLQLTKGERNQIDGEPAWTPDGQALIFAASLRDDADLRPDTDLYRVPAAGGPAVRLTSAEGDEGRPVVSADGRQLAYIGTVDAVTFYRQPELFVMPAAGGAARRLTAALDRPVTAASWAADGRGLHVSYNDAGLVRVAHVPLDGGRPRVVVPAIGGTRLYLPSSDGGFSTAAGTFAYTTAVADRPAGLGVSRGGAELARFDPSAAWRATKRIGKLEEVRYASTADALPIQAWTLYPPDFDPARKYPLLLDIHGGPNIDYGPYFSISHHLYAAAGYIVLFANPRGSIGYGEKFANGIDPKYGGTYPGKDHDDLMAGVDAMLARPYVDGRNLFIAGGSGGGVLTTNAIARTDRFRAAAALRPVTDWAVQNMTADIAATTTRYWLQATPWDNPERYRERSTLSLVGKVRTPTILITGEADWRTPIAQTEAYYQALKFRGIDTAMVRLPEAGHGMGRPSQWLQSNLVVIDWFGRYRVK